MIIRTILALALLCSFGHATAVSPPTIVLRGATVIDGTGAAPLADATIVIQNGRITAIGRAADIRVAAGARTLDLKGKFVIPGLMDGTSISILASRRNTFLRTRAAMTRSSSRRPRSR